jgi:hypothetical protein
MKNWQYESEFPIHEFKSFPEANKFYLDHPNLIGKERAVVKGK